MAVENYFWDSCVFSAYLRNEAAIYDIPSIEAFLNDAKAGKIVIYCSSLSSAEVLPSHIVTGGTFEDFMADYEGAVVPQDPDPNIMKMSGQFRDLPYKKGASAKRRLSTPDAIILATAIHLRDAYGVPFTAFHTYDGGGKKDIDGNKSIPLLGYETWCDDFNADQQTVAARVTSLNRCKPVHPAPMLPHVP
jgi:hypothetical protein